MGRPRDLQLERAWRQHFQRQRRSGLTVADYCHDHDLAESAFYAWRRIVAERDAEVESSGPAFVPVTVVPPTPTFSTSPIDIHLSGGQCVRVRPGCDRELLGMVLGILEAPAC